MYLNGFRAEDATAIIADIDNSDPHAYIYAKGITGTPQIGAYVQANLANLESALASFIAAVGYPWIAVGSLASMTWTNGTHGILAINLDHADFGISDSGTGIAYSGISTYSSFGYEPGTDFTTAQAAIRALQGNIAWTPSS